MKAWLLAVIGAFLLIGCALTPPASERPDRPTSRVYTASRSAAWDAVMREIGLRYPPRLVEKESGLLTTETVVMPAGIGNRDAGRWVHQPNEFLMLWDGLRMDMRVLVSPRPQGQVEVTIRTHFEGHESNLIGGWTPVPGNGWLEAELLDDIGVALHGASAPPER